MNQQDKNLLLERYVRDREDLLIEKYILMGPSALRDQMGLSENEWRILFDHLVFRLGLLSKTINQNFDFFFDNYVQHGSSHVRDILDVGDQAYDEIWQMSFDFLAIAHQGIIYHVMHHRKRYAETMKVRGQEFVRKVLGIWAVKYDEHWQKILVILLNTASDDIFAEQTFDHGLNTFSALISRDRVHRTIEKSEILRRGLVD